MIPRRGAMALAILIATLGVWLVGARTMRSHVTTTNTVLFDREIVRILDAHCVGCHRTGGLAEPLATYEETWLQRGPVLAAVLQRTMPPWAAVPGYGRFSNANGLTLRETQFLVSWVEGLGPRNDGAVFLNVRDPGDIPPAVAARADFSGWALGEPDFVGPLRATTVEPGDGRRIERIVVDPGLDRERWVGALEFRPGDRRVVRFATFRLEGSEQWLWSWTPWHGSVQLPEGAAYRLPPGSRIVAEVHYGTADETVVDQGLLGFHVVSGSNRPLRTPSDIVLETRGSVPALGRDVRFDEEVLVDRDTDVLALLPEYEPGIRSVEVSSRRSDGGTDVLLFARDLSLDWPTPYIFEEPVRISAGARLRVTAYYDNDTRRSAPGGIRLTVSTLDVDESR